MTPNIRPNTVMVYANSGNTKTSQLYHMAKLILKRAGPGKRIRMIHSDGGGLAPFDDSGMIERGEIEVFDFSNRQFALADIRFLSNGFWPIWTKDGQSFARYQEGSTEYFQRHEACMTQDWSNIAGYFIEGMTSTASMLLAHCSNRDDSNGGKVGFKESYRYEEQGEVFTGVAEGHYNIVQKEIYERHVKGFRTLPIPWLVWTALVGSGQDKKTKSPVRGPQVVGDAKTFEVPSWFNHVFHIETQTYDNSQHAKLYKALNIPYVPGPREGFVAWFTRHIVKDDLGQEVPYLCKSTVIPEMMPKILEYFPYGFVPLDYSFGIDVYFKILDALKKQMGQTKVG